MHTKKKKSLSLPKADVKSLDEFRKAYLPKTAEKGNLKKLSPTQFGERLAKESLRKVKELLSKP